MAIGFWIALAFAALPLPAAAQSPPSTPAAGRTFLYQGEATSILGRQVLGPDGGVVGRIVDVLVGDGSLPRAAVIDFGGFLGVGNRRVAVTWSSLSFSPGTRTITLDMTADQIRAIPQFRQPDKPADPPVSVAIPPDPKVPRPDGP
ncbi:MAG: PRC-barrel domain-containing protein [Alphaproteobacteria bacterium]|nr:PRC-barrel domain-containing protein [Alphaproteobacteria bacterium]